MDIEHMRRTAAAIVGAGALLAFTSAKPAEAVSFTTYTDYSLWAADVVGTIATENFEYPPVTTATSPSGSFRDGTVDFNGDGVIPAAGLTGQLDPDPGDVWSDVVTQGGSSLQTIWTFDSAIRAWGAYWDLSPGGQGTGLNLFISGGPLGASTTFIKDPMSMSTASIDHGTSGFSFFGFIADTSFQKVLVQTDTQGQSGDDGGQETYYMDNMVYAPEPGILTLLGMGLAGAAFWMRRRRN